MLRKSAEGRYGLVEDSDDDDEGDAKEGAKPKEASRTGRVSEAGGQPEDAAAGEGQEQGPQEEAMQLSAQHTQSCTFGSVVVLKRSQSIDVQENKDIAVGVITLEHLFSYPACLSPLTQADIRTVCDSSFTVPYQATTRRKGRRLWTATASTGLIWRKRRAGPT